MWKFSHNEHLCASGVGAPPLDTQLTQAQPTMFYIPTLDSSGGYFCTKSPVLNASAILHLRDHKEWHG